MAKYLARIYVPQGDKSNIEISTYEKAIKLLGVDEEDEKQRIKWGGRFKDVYFKGTNDYIRIIN